MWFVYVVSSVLVVTGLLFLWASNHGTPMRWIIAELLLVVLGLAFFLTGQVML